MTWTLFLELLAKSSVIAGAGLALSAVLAFRPASDRADMLRAAVCLLIALPVFLIIGPRLPLAWLAAPEAAAAAPPASEALTVNLEPIAKASLVASLPTVPLWAVIAAFAYAAGVLALAGRFVLGLWTLTRWTETGHAVKGQAWADALRRLDPAGRTRLVASVRVEAPLSWGLPPGVVLIGEDCVRRPETAPAVLAHELAHIQRGDWLFLTLSRLALAVFWFNPLVWLLHATLSARTEEAADAAAVAWVDRQTYARVLVDLASDFAQPAALGMAGSRNALARRIACIMNTQRKLPSRPVAMALAVGALVAVATPLAAVELLPRPPAPPQPPRAISAPFAPLAPVAPPAPPQEPGVPAPPAPPAHASGSRYVITNNGVTRSYSSIDEMDPETRREFEQAHAEAAQARVHAEAARREAERVRASIDYAAIDRARDEGRRAAAEARVHAEAARREADRVRASIDHGAIQRAAEAARTQAEVARREAREAMVEARASMRSGADDMVRGAEQMRTEGRRLRDPAYRAEVIADNRQRGNDVTDAELIELSRKLPGQADDMDRQAQRMREQASRDL